MRKVIASVYMSLDGIITRPEKWTFESRDDKANSYALDQLFACDALLMGRETYDVFAVVWPTMSDEAGFADRMNTMRKYVVSSTLDKAEWPNSVIIEADLADEVAKLKGEPGQDILIYGYGGVTDTLLEHGLLDELRIWLHPLLVGTGEMSDLLFRDGTRHNLRLLDTRSFDSGLLILCYQPVGPRE